MHYIVLCKIKLSDIIFELDQCHFIMKYVHENVNKKIYFEMGCLFKYKYMYSGIAQICRSEVWEHRRKQRYEENSDALNHVCVFGSQYFDGFNVGKRHLSISCPWVSLFMLHKVTQYSHSNIRSLTLTFKENTQHYVSNRKK